MSSKLVKPTRRQINKKEMTREQEMQMAKLLGKHVSPRKAMILLVLTSIACMLPAFLGLGLYNSIPEQVSTGIVNWKGVEDMLPRPVLVFGIPGLCLLLNLIIHGQLFLAQKAGVVPKGMMRLFGRWGMSVICTAVALPYIYRASGTTVPSGAAPAAAAGLILSILGTYFLECEDDAFITRMFSYTGRTGEERAPLHRFTSVFWMSAGFLFLVFSVLRISFPPMVFVTCAAVIVPFAAGFILK